MGMVVVGLFVLALQYAYERLTPDYFWVEYESTEITDLTAEGLIVQSSSVFPRGGVVEWNDVLRCDLGDLDGNFKFYSFYNSSVQTMGDNTFDETPWVYPATARIPASGACFIDSAITVRTPLGATKEEYVQSNVFEIGG